MQGLLLHCGGKEVSWKDVCDTPTPPPRGRVYHPIPHRTLVETVTNQLRDAGVTIAEQTHALNQNGALYFGMMRLAAKDGRDYATVLGLRNGHRFQDVDPESGEATGYGRKIAASFVMGSQVFVCDNLCFSGEVKVARKHTTNILQDLPGLVAMGIGKLSRSRVEQDKRLSFYKEVNVNSLQAHDWLVRACVDQKLFPGSKLPRILKEFRTPEHEEFLSDDGEHTAWTLMNAVTEHQKGSNLFNMPKKQSQMIAMLDSLVGRPNYEDWNFHPEDEVIEAELV